MLLLHHGRMWAIDVLRRMLIDPQPLSMMCGELVQDLQPIYGY
ncbi:hypothetical protein [Symmachiella dynata]